MKPFLSLMTAMLLLSGCGNRAAETEKKLVETQQKLDEATKALQAAQEAALKEYPAVKPESQSALDKTQEQVKTTAGHVETAAKDVKAVAADEKNRTTAEARQKAAALAEAKAKEARKIAEPPKIHTMRAGTPLVVRTLTPLSTKTSEVGSTVEATLAQPLIVEGYTAAERGAMLRGVVTQSDPGGRVKGRASLGLELRSLTLSDGRTINIKTQDVYQVAQGTKKKDAMKIGIASGIGAAIGAIAGGGRGAAIGAGAGAAGGTGWTLSTRGDAAVLPSESLLTFRLAEAISVMEVPKKSLL